MIPNNVSLILLRVRSAKQLHFPSFEDSNHRDVADDSATSNGIKLFHFEQKLHYRAPGLDTIARALCLRRDENANVRAVAGTVSRRRSQLLARLLHTNRPIVILRAVKAAQMLQACLECVVEQFLARPLHVTLVIEPAQIIRRDALFVEPSQSESR